MAFFLASVCCLPQASLSWHPLTTILFIGLGATKPSTRLRIQPLVEHLRGQGHAVALRNVPHSLAGRLELLYLATQYDVVVLQKKLFPALYVEMLRRANPRLIFDVDDAIMFHEIERREPVSGRFFRRFATIAAASRIVIAGNAYVAEFARAARSDGEGGVHVLPTPIDTERLSPPAVKIVHAEVIAGWIGTKGNLHQLAAIAPALRKVADEIPGFRLRIIADGGIEIDGLTVETRPWQADEEVSALHGFDIGLMPLEDNLWNRGKGGYKLLQYMATGLPAIASPVGINSEIISDGDNGFLAGDLETWAARLIQLARDAALRERLGRAARATVEARYSLTTYLDRYTALIESCCQ